MTRNPHFESVTSWVSARERLTFEPLVPSQTAGFSLDSLAIYVRDYKLRELPPQERSLEAHYGGFVFTQSRPGASEARHQALELSYGRSPMDAQIVGREGRAYELGPDVPPDDIDGRSPAVVVWHDDDMFYLIASTRLRADELIGIATSVYLSR